MTDVNEYDVTDVVEAKTTPAVQQSQVQLPPKFLGCPLFRESYRDCVGIEPADGNSTAEFNDRRVKNALIGKKLEQFMTNKRQDIRSKFNKHDRGSPPESIYAITTPKVRHSHLSSDISIWYEVDDTQNPPLIMLYGVFTHEQTGTDTTPKRGKQQAMADRFVKQKDKFTTL